jgi:uncharacterized glyoxalase superfamily protein PhnB
MTLIVNDQDAAIEFYTTAFGAEIRGDNGFEMCAGKMRWFTVGIPNDNNMTVVDDVDAFCKQAQAAGARLAPRHKTCPGADPPSFATLTEIPGTKSRPCDPNSL